MKKALVIGGGPAGLTAAYELLNQSDEYEVTVLEEGTQVGGISKTVAYHGNRMDMGGHRFFSKVPEVNEWWERMLPTQGAMPWDDRKLGRTSQVKAGGPDPEKTDRVMLRRNRLSRIFFNAKFFDYPISLKMETIRNMGLGTTIVVEPCSTSGRKSPWRTSTSTASERSCTPCSSSTTRRTCGAGTPARSIPPGGRSG